MYKAKINYWVYCVQYSRAGSMTMMCIPFGHDFCGAIKAQHIDHFVFRPSVLFVRMSNFAFAGATCFPWNTSSTFA